MALIACIRRPGRGVPATCTWRCTQMAPDRGCRCSSLQGAQRCASKTHACNAYTYNPERHTTNTLTRHTLIYLHTTNHNIDIHTHTSTHIHTTICTHISTPPASHRSHILLLPPHTHTRASTQPITLARIHYIRTQLHTTIYTQPSTHTSTHSHRHITLTVSPHTHLHTTNHNRTHPAHTPHLHPHMHPHIQRHTHSRSFTYPHTPMHASALTHTHTFIVTRS